MAEARVEMLVEPFRENAPGEHVHAVIDALAAAGLNPDMGPFATTAEGSLEVVSAAVQSAIAAAMDRGATAIQIRVERGDG